MKKENENKPLLQTGDRPCVMGSRLIHGDDWLAVKNRVSIMNETYLMISIYAASIYNSDTCAQTTQTWECGFKNSQHVAMKTQRRTFID